MAILLPTALQGRPDPAAKTKRRKTVSSRHARPLSPAKQLAQRLFPPKRKSTHTQKLGARWLPQLSRQEPQKRGKLSAAWHKLTGGGKPPSPGQDGAIDTTLAWGDVLMLITTQTASERVPLWQAGILSTVLVGSWVAVSLAKGDYLNREASFPFLLGLDMSHLFEALWRSVSTWVLFTPIALALCASLVSHSYIDWHPFAAPHVLHGHHDLPAELEVMLASLFTVTCWRGAWALLRPFL